MKKIKAIRVNDEEHLDTLAENNKLNKTSYPELRNEKQILLQA